MNPNYIIIDPSNDFLFSITAIQATIPNTTALAQFNKRCSSTTHFIQDKVAVSFSFGSYTQLILNLVEANKSELEYNLPYATANNLRNILHAIFSILGITVILPPQYISPTRYGKEVHNES